MRSTFLAIFAALLFNLFGVTCVEAMTMEEFLALSPEHRAKVVAAKCGSDHMCNESEIKNLVLKSIPAMNNQATDQDQDNDGYDSISFGGKDCHDRDPSIHPSTVDFCGNGIDEDCTNGDAVCPTSAVNKDKTVKVEVTCLDPKNGKPFYGCEMHIYHWTTNSGYQDTFGRSVKGKPFVLTLTNNQVCGSGQNEEFKARFLNKNGTAGEWYGDNGTPMMQNTVRVTINGKTVNRPGKKGPHLSYKKGPWTNAEGNLVVKPKDIKSCNPTDDSPTLEDGICWTTRSDHELVITTFEYSGKNTAYNTFTRQGKFCKPSNDGKTYMVYPQRIAADNNP